MNRRGFDLLRPSGSVRVMLTVSEKFTRGSSDSGNSSFAWPALFGTISPASGTPAMTVLRRRATPAKE
jgi:hypothetical protein